MKHAVGIDIGGTKTALATVNADGRIAHTITLPTNSAAGFDDGERRIVKAIEQVVTQRALSLSEIVGIGIGCAGPVDPIRGTIQNPYTLPGWEEANIVERLSNRFNLPVRLENDADAALLGECQFGAGRGGDPVVMLTFGTGVGGGVWTGGRILRGARGQHLELGHLRVASEGPECYCGTCGCLESLASGSAIAALGRESGFADARAVFAAARSQDAAALAILHRAIDAVRTAIWNIAHSLLPQRVILGGGIMEEHFGLFEPGLADAVAGATQFRRGSLTLAPAQLGNRAGLVGAAGLMFP